MGLVVKIDELKNITENLVEEFFAEGVTERILEVLDFNVTGFTPMGHFYSQGKREVRRMLQDGYDRLAPCNINKIRSGQFNDEEYIAIESHVILTSRQQKKVLLLDINIMYRKTPEGFSVIGINVSKDYDRERNYEMITSAAKDDYEYLAAYDSFTGLLNREAFCNRTADMLIDYPDKSFVILRINIERFKVINEVFGEAEGDKLLNYIARFLKSIDLKLCQAARLYADNFVVCFESGAGAAEHMIYTLQVVANSFEINHHTVLSFGLYKVDDRNIPVSTMIERANIALNQVSKTRRVRYCVYEEKMRDKMLMEQKIINDLEGAFANNEFVLAFQPKYELAGESIIGSEALIRWTTKDGEMIPPSQFISVFEKNGSIYDIDKFMWEKVCQLIRQWIDEGKDVKPVSVNVSRIDLYDPELTDVLVGLVNKYKIPRRLLELEITESAYTDDPQMIMTVVEKLQEAGFCILMDDFGSGYSSLNMLKDIHIDVLKIDMGFLQSTELTGRGTIILSSVVQMAKKLNLPTIAEGVETKEQVDMLKSIGCDWAQGYYYSMPISVEEFVRLF
ncbi:MAG: bifunctional diguanylate cyclase/phosphodiesterase [Anaerovibrio sp.]|uniref:putative bifunctional diguanylate cyclase/phosphodiesterase n=1 Tax=Anaerovibrio sp. TaxID=1872532 RepID=UPI0025D47506|nr:bifunctional diguanylate cyclase/phosphodiesterase [Anaerovibrio sp.]MCR5177176.1 bifunctional diguanylate cyclase/phosphodiesterase [Anaerovibrio sp.]